jgi:chromate transporter
MTPPEPGPATPAGTTAASDAAQRVPPPSERPRPASSLELFTAFTRLALQGFGGVLPIAQRELVDRRQWLSREDFLELLSVGQVLPGPNVVNLSLMVGGRFFGWRGALASMAGMLLVPLVIVLALAVLHASVASNPVVEGALRGMGAVAAGLILAMAVKLLPALRRNPGGIGFCAVLGLATFVAIGVLRWPLAAVVAGFGGIGIGWAWWCLARDAGRRAAAGPSGR